MTSPAISPRTSRPSRSNQHLWVWIAAAVIVAVAAITWFLISRGGSMPRLNDNVVALTKFIETDRFEQIPFDQQRQYYKVMDDRDDDLDQAFANKQITESQYRTGLEAAWLGKHLNRVEKYFSLAPGAPRTAYIDKLLEKKERKRNKPNQDPNDIDADETAAELKVERWPAALRSQWQQFHDAYRAQRKAAKDAERAQTRPAR